MKSSAKMRSKQIVLIVMLIGSAISISGCIVAAVGAVGTIAYAKGDLEAVESEKLDLVYEAALKSMEELEMYVILKEKDSLSAEIDARDSQDKKITIKLTATSQGTTDLSIRVGVLGNETQSMLIYQKIHDNLKDIQEYRRAGSERDELNTYKNFPVTHYRYDATSRKGTLSVDITGQGIEARQSVIENIGKICADKNITLVHGKEADQEAHYLILDEYFEDGILTIEFEAVW
jgi:hypothetical protein